MASINAKIARPDERSDARERALYLLYEAHSKGISPADALSLQVLEPDELTVVLVTGVETHAAELDAAIAAKAKGWTLELMTAASLSMECSPRFLKSYDRTIRFADARLMP